MHVTNVRLKMIADGSKVRAVCSVFLDDAFAVHNLRIVEGSKGVFVSMPRHKTQNGEYRDLAHPITREARDMFQQEILAAYERSRVEQRRLEQRPASEPRPALEQRSEFGESPSPTSDQSSAFDQIPSFEHGPSFDGSPAFDPSSELERAGD